MSTKKIGEILTFYSFKGGTGRTMTLANLAVLASKLSDLILIIDWDLEAPGLHKFFYKNIPSSEYDDKLGLIDLFVDIENATKNIETIIDRESIWPILDRIDINNYIVNTSLNGIHLIKAGKFDESYPERINKFDWIAFFNRIPSFFLFFAEYIKHKFDYIFIDSRTGFTDTAGICSTLLPDKLCLVFTTNRQSLEGVWDLARKALTYRINSPDFRPLKIYPIPSRVEIAEKDLREIWRKGKVDEDIVGYQPLFEQVFEEFYEIDNCDLTSYFDVIQIHHEPKYSYGESIAVLTEAFSDSLSLTNTYSNLLQKIILDSTIYTEKIDDELFSTDEIKVLFSYAQEDVDFSKKIMEALNNEKRISVLNLKKAENTPEDSLYQIDNCEVFIPIITKNYIKSELSKYRLNLFLKNFIENDILLITPIVIGVNRSDLPTLYRNMANLFYADNDKSVFRICEDLMDKIFSGVLKKLNHDLENSSQFGLTKNEIQFLQLAASEMTYQQIAEKMGLSPKTIDGYRDALFKKLKVTSRVGLALFAVKNGYVTVE